MTEPTLTHRLILLQMRQNQQLVNSLAFEMKAVAVPVVAAEYQNSADRFRIYARNLLEQAEKLLEQSEQEERSDADVWEETCQVVRPQA